MGMVGVRFEDRVGVNAKALGETLSQMFHNEND
jgi:hypothetical protein